MAVRVSVVVMISISLIWLSAQRLSPTENDVKRSTISLYWRRGDFRHPVAVGGGAGDLARLRRDLPRVFCVRRRAAAARHRDPAGLLRDPGAALRGARPHAADEPARRRRRVEQEPDLARGGPAGGARLDP